MRFASEVNKKVIKRALRKMDGVFMHGFGWCVFSVMSNQKGSRTRRGALRYFGKG